MKIASAACMSTRVFQDQPVWDRIAAQNTDYLVLLGGSIYININADSEHQDPSEMMDDEFAQHVHGLYSELIHQPQFASLVTALPRGDVFGVWDDHDFLWNNMYGDLARRNMRLRDKGFISTVPQEAFRKALAQGLTPDSFPADPRDPALTPKPDVPLSTPSIDLGENGWLHLANVHTFRTKPSGEVLLGAAQRNQIGNAIAATQNALHLLASGSTLTLGGSYSSWKRFEDDVNWLKQLAAVHRTIVASGDIHKNHAEQHDTPGLP